MNPYGNAIDNMNPTLISDPFSLEGVARVTLFSIPILDDPAVQRCCHENNKTNQNDNHIDTICQPDNYVSIPT